MMQNETHVPNSPSTSHFSCFVIGDGTLTIQCMEMLLEAGHSVYGLVTNNQQLRDWAASKEIPQYEPNADYAESLAKQPFDYLFSIANLRITADKVLELPQKAAINFHDGILPRYSGLNVTTWALMNQETTHGVTWHLMQSKVDAGAILKRQTFDIATDETSLTLNTKCFKAGIDTFQELIVELAADTVEHVAQDLTDRQYFGKNKRPAAAGVVNWQQDAEKIDALVRALDFGQYANPIGLAKCVIGDDVWVFKSLNILTDDSTASPGTIVSLNDTHIVVATATKDVSISDFYSLAGQSVSLPSINLTQGTILPIWDDNRSARLTQLNGDLSKNESFWASKLAQIEPINVPYLQRSHKEAGAEPAIKEVEIPLPDTLSQVAAFLGEDHTNEDVFAAAFCAYLSRLTGQEKLTIGLPSTHEPLEERALAGMFSNHVPWNARVDGSEPAATTLANLAEQRAKTIKRRTFIGDVYARFPELEHLASQGGLPAFDVVIGQRNLASTGSSNDRATLTITIDANGSASTWIYDANAVKDADIQQMQEQFNRFLQQIVEDKTLRLNDVSLLTESASQRLFQEWNDTQREFPSNSCVHQLFEQQVEKTPDAIALVSRGEEISYKSLNERANQMAHYLGEKGVGRETRVGVCTNRSLDMLVGVMGVLKIGGAYVPLDPDFPQDRIAYMVEDAEIPVLIAQKPLLDRLPESDAQVICVDSDWEEIANESTENPNSNVDPGNLSYVIYTSGSTGRPKGVMVEHRNVANFFTGMDACIDHEPPGVWLAVTSLSFDISVLELFWTLARGFKVVLYDVSEERANPAVNSAPMHAGTGMDFSVYFFASDEGGASAADKYRLLLESAKYADENGFVAAWTPERHFHAFGGLYPNPSVAGAAIAATTKNLGVRAGSCVSPLHSPIRIAEEWAVVDNLSGGRVGISFAAGWQPNDFVLSPGTFKDRKKIMFEQIDAVQTLWKGGSLPYENGNGEMIEVKTLPRPVQPELPVWITAASNPETFRMAGEKGYNLLTHLLGQSVEELAEKIAVYRKGRKDKGHEGEGTVSLMLHTFVGENDDEVREIVREPMKSYLKSSIGLIKAAAWSFPTFKQKTPGDDGNFSLSHLSDTDIDDVLNFSFERYFETSGLFGTVETCLKIVDELKGIGVDEIACLIDYGVPTDVMLNQLPLLNEVRERSNQKGSTAAAVYDPSIAGLIAQNEVTHLQCTPSMASMLTEDPRTRTALSTLQCMMVGGEAFPVALSQTLRDLVSGKVINMYGPTETTIWSTTWNVNGESDSVPIGKPIANTQIYVLDANRQPVPIGIPGELYIGGTGVVRGYLGRPEQTSERFQTDPFSQTDGNRMYRTGDLVRHREDGVLEFLSRIDHQVKIRGYRIGSR